MSSPLEPTAEQFAALAARPANEPVVMVNLLRFKTPDGLAAYQRYGVAVIPHLEHAGAVVRYAGIAPTVVVGEGEKPWWDAILIVEYPSPQAFIEMVSDPGYAKAHEHRVEALDRGDLIATSVWSLTLD